jgi:hypothetical protein
MDLTLASSNNRVIRSLKFVALATAATLLAGCVGGTTYGTGVSQEAQTFKDLTNILSLKKKTTVIDYSSRSDIVVPEQKTLVEPRVDQAAEVTPTDWPETPEQKIARIRAEAEEANGGSLAQQIAFANQDKDLPTAPRKKILKAAPLGQGVPNVSCDPDGVIMRRCTDGEIRQAVLAVRNQGASSSTTVAQRRYLTEPPVVYRTPATTAVSGDAGYTEAELAEIARQKKERQLDLQNSKY